MRIPPALWPGLAAVLFVNSVEAMVQKQPSPATNWKPPYSAAPDLALRFKDAFDKDTREQFEADKPLRWQAGQLSLPANASLYRHLTAGPWLELHLNWQLDPPENGQSSETRIWLDFRTATDSYLRVRQSKRKTGMSVEVAIVDTGDEWDVQSERVVVAQQKDLGPEGVNGVLKLDYRYGQWRIDLPGREQPVFGYVDNQAAEPAGFLIQTGTTGLTLKSVASWAGDAQTVELPPAVEVKLDEATEFRRAASEARDGRNFAAAIEELEKAAEIYRDSLGEFSLAHIEAMSDLAYLCTWSGNYSVAETIHLRVLKYRQQTTGANHPMIHYSLINLGSLYKRMGLFEKAEPMFSQSLRILEATGQTSDNVYSTCLINLGHLHEVMHQHRQAERYYLQAIERTKATLGREHVEYAENLNFLAGLYKKLGLLSEAEVIYHEAQTIFQQIGANRSHNFLSLRRNHGDLLAKMGRDAESRAEFQKALELSESLYGRNHVEYGKTYSRLADALLDRNDQDAASEAYQKAIELAERNPAVVTEYYPNAINNLASIHFFRKEFDSAEKLFQKGLRYRKRVQGVEHPDHLAGLRNLAIVHCQMGRLEAAERAAALAVQMHQKKLDQYSVIQAESEQLKLLATSNSFLGLYLVLAGKLPAVGPKAFEFAVTQRGAVLARQQKYRELAADPQTAELFAELSEIASQLSHHVNRPAAVTPNWSERKFRLESRYADVEKQIAARSGEVTARSQPIDVVKFAASLPNQSAFVMYVRFVDLKPGLENGRLKSEASLAAFVVKHDKAQTPQVSLIRLGPEKPIQTAVRNWRAPIAAANETGLGMTQKGKRRMEKAAATLRKLVWEPVEKKLDGNDLVLVSPDGALNEFPLLALPGSQPGSYLLEERKLVTIPIPRQLPDRLAVPPVRLNSDSKIVVAGNIDYGTPSREDVQRGAEDEFGPTKLLAARGGVSPLNFNGLPFSVKEVKSIGQRFPRARILEKDQASESAFKRSILGVNILHVASHGFFRPDALLPPDDQEAIIQTRPSRPLRNANLRSGLAFANANRALQFKPETSADDGILYSAEIASLPMNHVELAVLSACETGLGSREAGGEGLIGIQRAFQVAGAKSTIASFWKVDDRATQLMMNRFYDNLVEYSSRPDEKDPAGWSVRIDALRDAQLWMLNQPGVASLTNRGEPIEVDPDRIKTVPPPQQDGRGRTHPRFWAAFVLSGDWR